jgi:hypothetical protein
MLNFFNTMGKTIDIIGENGKVERQYLTEEKLHELLSKNKRSLKGHRGSYKTTAIVIIGCILRMLFEPNVRIGIIRKSFTKSSEILTAISKMMQIAHIKQIFKLAHGEEPKPTKDSANVLSFNFKTIITPENNINAYGIHQDFIGKHFDIIICDDFITLEDRISQAERDKTKIHLEELTNNILDPGKLIMYLGTVWHRNDGWVLCPDALCFDWKITKIMTEETIQEKKTSMTRIMFEANYNLSHVASDEQMFVEAKWLRWNYHYKKKVYGHIDAKYSGNHTNGLCFMVEKDDGRIQAIGFCFHEHVNDKLDFIVKKYKKYFCSQFFCEDNADKGFLAEKLIKKGMNVETYHESMNKHVKIEDYGYPNWDNIDWDVDTDPEYISQILDYEEGEEPDDCADNFSSLIRIKFDKNNSNMDRWKW